MTRGIFFECRAWSGDQRGTPTTKKRPLICTHDKQLRYISLGNGIDLLRTIKHVQHCSNIFKTVKNITLRIS